LAQLWAPDRVSLAFAGTATASTSAWPWLDHPDRLVRVLEPAPVAGEVRSNSALYIGGVAGWTDAIYYLDTNGSTVLFRVDQVGKVTSGTHIPRTTDTYLLGDGTNNWNVANVNFYVATNSGNAGGPTYTWLGDTDTGLYRIGADSFGATTGGTLRLTLSTTALTSTLPVLVPNGTVANPGLGFATDVDNGLILATTNAIGLVTAGTEQVRITATGLVDFRNGGTQNVALGGGAAPTLGTIGGSGPAAAAQAGWIKMALGGTAIFFPYWV
jgi:hypothetical protein